MTPRARARTTFANALSFSRALADARAIESAPRWERKVAIADGAPGLEAMKLGTAARPDGVPSLLERAPNSFAQSPIYDI